MNSHLRYAGQGAQVQRAALEVIVREHDVAMYVLTKLRESALPDHFIGSGAIYNAAWNHLTGNPSLPEPRI